MDKVLVTGATGYVATELIKQLLEKGYNVVGTVRSSGQSSRTDTLRKLGEALPGTLELVQADLTGSPGSFDVAMKGCDVVFHTASPFVIESEDPQKHIIDVAVKGTRNVLSSVVKSKAAIRRVVLTSSVAAVHGEYGAAPLNGLLYTEEDYNETSTIEQGQAYHLSKTLAEKQAWEIAKENGIDLVTICPNFVMGPALSPQADSLSIGHMKGILEGKPNSGAPIVCDVRDVARAHVLAAETPSASGRYIVSEKGPVSSKFVSDLFQKRFPGYSFPDGQEAEENNRIDNSRVQRELGLQLTPLESTFMDMAVTLIQLGIAHPKEI